jgi:hypothetical protein
MEPSDAAKRVLIAYRQLEAILQPGVVGASSVTAAADSYDKILETLKQCFSVDPLFEDAVKHLHSPSRGAGKLPLVHQLET